MTTRPDNARHLPETGDDVGVGITPTDRTHFGQYAHQQELVQERPKPPSGGQSTTPAANVAQNPAPKAGWIVCARCQATWSGLNTAHADGCHRTFTVHGASDKHRAGSHTQDERHCLDPASVGLVDAGRAYPCWGFPGRDASGGSPLQALPPGSVLDGAGYAGPGHNIGCEDEPKDPDVAPVHFQTIGDITVPGGADPNTLIKQVGDTWRSWGWYVFEREGFPKPNQFGYAPDGYRLQIEASNPPSYPPTLQGSTPCFPGHIATDDVDYPARLTAEG